MENAAFRRLLYTLAITCLFYPLFVVSGSQRCGYENTQALATQDLVEMYGNCVPYDSSTVEHGTPCDVFFTQGVSYVYIPLTRGKARGDLESYLRFFMDTDLAFNLAPERCIKEARLILCHFALPPCGNVTVFEPPTSVCEDVCNYLRSLCPEEFLQVSEYFRIRTDLARYGLTMINCSNTGEYLEPLEHCCSDLTIKIPCTKVNDSGDLIPDPDCIGSSTEKSIGVAVGPTAVGVAVIALIVITVVIIILRRKRKLRKEEVFKNTASPVRSRSSDSTHNYNNTHQLSIPSESTPRARVSSGYIRQMADESLLIPGRILSLIDTIGQGEFGVVYRGSLIGWPTKGEQGVVAIKTLKGIFTTTDLSNMMEESVKMSKFNHPNVMKLIGVCIDKGASPYIVMPYMVYGSLLSYLKKQRAELTLANEDDQELVTATQKKLLSMCLQVAEGMSYLASQQFVHRDLAARNCMIDEKFVLKVADFGLSEDIYARNYFRQSTLGEEGDAPVKLPVRWMAVESLHDGIFTEKTDVWSFGVTMWEVFSLGRIPYPGVDTFSLIKFLDGGGRLDKPANAACSHDIYVIMSDCWKDDPVMRPHFFDLVTTTATNLERIAGYLDFSFDSSQQQMSSYDHLTTEGFHEVKNLTDAYDKLNPTVIITDDTVMLQ